jgi:two-component system, chemotaxis family, protein-glutamate methylesterase/glutaminase
VIALIASAGGISAVGDVLASMDPEVRAAVLVLVHLDPGRSSHLVEIFARRSRLPVERATHGSMLREATVYVAPPGKHLLVTPGPSLALIESGQAPPSRPSGDLLLTTLAVAVGPRATAVVLSGAGHDGATGATAIHAFGGTVIASDRASSEPFSMPRATIERDNAIDHVLAVEDIAGELRSIVGSSITRQ